MHIVFRPQSYLLLVWNCKPLIPGASVSFICECILAIYHHGNALKLHHPKYLDLATVEQNSHYLHLYEYSFCLYLRVQ